MQELWERFSCALDSPIQISVREIEKEESGVFAPDLAD
jgi:hypothetical protein